jgi:hypothetical protein
LEYESAHVTFFLVDADEDELAAMSVKLLLFEELSILKNKYNYLIENKKIAKRY